MDPKPIMINGYDTYFTDTGTYILIAIPLDAGKDISDICGTFVNGHLTRMIDYDTINGIRFIKAHY